MTIKSKSHRKEGIHEVFDEISPTYDLVNRVLSFGLDILWRKKLVDSLGPIKNYRLLDIATGTGDVALQIAKKKPFATQICGVDPSKKMLDRARLKSAKTRNLFPICFEEGSAESLQYEDDSFDYITISFGLRNLHDRQKSYDEMLRVLSKDGHALILEFSLPKNRLLRALHLFYLRHILPVLGGIISKKPSAYRYLNETIESFPYGNELILELKQAGFTSVQHLPLSFGIATLYIASK